MDHYKSVHPWKYYKDYLAHNVRPDGRGIDKIRNVAINIKSIQTCNGSAVVRIGNTCVVCGIKAELGPPKTEAPENGFLIINVELPPLCSSQFKPGLPHEKAQVVNAFLNDIIERTGIIDLETLCVHTGKLVWNLYCDIYCLNYDGSVVDVCMTSLVAALSSVTLPNVEYNSDSGLISVNDAIHSPLKLIHKPISTTFSIIDDQTILIDPCKEEESLGSGTFSIVISNGDICAIRKPGGKAITDTQMAKCILDAKNRTSLIYKLIKETNKSSKILEMQTES